MKNLISIVEIPTLDFPRALSFYQAILGVTIEEVDMGGVKMGVFPSDGETVNVTLINGGESMPSMDGTIVYLNAGDNLQSTLDKVRLNGGKVVVPKTQISPEIGFFAMFTDTEGNKLGLHSIH
jgi:predicted enzyme related to lactoylglutathione lyase